MLRTQPAQVMRGTLDGRKGDTVSDVHPEQASPAHAEVAFGFLSDLGFVLVERWVTGGNDFRGGWRLTYDSSELRVIVQYLDVEFEVHFRRGELDASYLFIDRELFGRRSGFGGDMFPPQKLASAIDRIADDIRQNYATILAGDVEAWRRIEHLLKTPPAKGNRLP